MSVQEKMYDQWKEGLDFQYLRKIKKTVIKVDQELMRNKWAEIKAMERMLKYDRLDFLYPLARKNLTTLRELIETAIQQNKTKEK